MKIKTLIATFTVVAAITYTAHTAYSNAQAEYTRQRLELEKEHKQRTLRRIKEKITQDFFAAEAIPGSVTVEGIEYEVEYSLNPELNDFLEKLLRRHRSDYSAIVVLDNGTGEILGAAGFERAANQKNRHLPFSSTHPAASLIKIVTAADLLENKAITPNTKFEFHGRGTTLYRSQILPRHNRRGRAQKLETAFAYSNNVVFGRAAVEMSEPYSFYQMATDFGFNTSLMNDLNLSESIFPLPADDYNFAELASGFNRTTMISPVHASVLASVVANRGVRRDPWIIRSIKDKTSGEVLFKASEGPAEKVLSEEVAEDLRQMMLATTKFGTARGYFRRMPRGLSHKVEVGGKTGSITGGVPLGKRDWFVAYASPKGEYWGKGISVAVMNVNIDKWYVKSTFLAREVISHFYSRIRPIEELAMNRDERKSLEL